MDERQLLEEGVVRLRALVGDSFEVTAVNRMAVEPRNGLLPGLPDAGADMLLSVGGGGGSYAQVYVEVKQRLTPAQVRTVLAPRAALVRRLTGDAAFLVVAPWLSPRTREALEDSGFSYLDLTGNVWFQLRRPPAIIRLSGASQSPDPPKRATQQLRGDRAGRLARILADVVPPYRATDLAVAAGLSLPYVSRLLSALDDEALITRSGRTVVDVDWATLLQERARQYGLLRANPYTALLSPRGVLAARDRLTAARHRLEERGQLVLTGSLAAAEVEPVSVGGQLLLYVSTKDAQQAVTSELGLMPVETGANVLLLEPADPVVYARRREVGGFPHVALSQLALDCLGGPGRLPAEGQALLEHMRTRESEWRLPALDNLVVPRR